MNAASDRTLTQNNRSIPAIAVHGRVARAVIATLVIGGYMALGFAFQLSAEAYLLLGIPITLAFQVLVVRQPLRALWLRGTPPITFTPPSTVAVVVVAIAPAVIVIRGVRDGDPVLAAYGLGAIVGAVGAVYTMRAMGRDAVRSTIRTTLITGAILVGMMVAFRVVSGGFDGNLATAVATAVISVATYVPVVFVIEEVHVPRAPRHVPARLHARPRSRVGPLRVGPLGTLASPRGIHRPRDPDDPVPRGCPHSPWLLPGDLVAPDRESRRAGYRTRRDRRFAECGRRPVADGPSDRRSQMQDVTLLAAIAATGLFPPMAAFEATLAAGAPLGAHFLGGRHSGVLPPRLRAS